VTSSAPSGPAIDVPLIDKGGRVERLSDAPDCVLLAGRIALDRANEALFAGVLPSRILVRASSPRAAGLRALVEQLLDEQTSALPGSRVASEKIAELLFVQVLRAHLATADALPPGWLAAVTDTRIIRALRLMHEEPGRAWTLDALAKAAGMSRTRFAVHFRAVAGLAPLAYLGAWRMRLAQRVLLEEDTPVRALADTLGYGSESAFSHAFKRITGLSPRDYRVATRRDAGLASLPRTERARKFPAIPRIRAAAGAP
jgi:AraC-like DNA-binding protein